jgi:hypothetical protein
MLQITRPLALGQTAAVALREEMSQGRRGGDEMAATVRGENRKFGPWNLGHMEPAGKPGLGTALGDDFA